MEEKGRTYFWFKVTGFPEMFSKISNINTRLFFYYINVACPKKKSGYPEIF